MYTYKYGLMKGNNQRGNSKYLSAVSNEAQQIELKLTAKALVLNVIHFQWNLYTGSVA